MANIVIIDIINKKEKRKTLIKINKKSVKYDILVIRRYIVGKVV